ncbi:FimV family protein [Jeongeupia naejangsanensis]|uniref:FimV family protein n=1 Tax=Jeongeupia naejangsanensis TaxID=613195 RepID=A0ABS2BJ60_9NEIS|nr:FimV family protein [Jeongeupia naejangsanensis]MBM3115634.1 FimV family protein [Jeongeupia naejangsanensis]
MMLASPWTAHAAGLGKLNVVSGLGQPFRAEIDLTSVQPGEADSLAVSLASPEGYANAQVPYPPTSLGLRFNIDKRANGQYYVLVTSGQAVNEPFLGLLVELNWASGRIQREYSALIDPVGYGSSGSAALPGRVSGKGASESTSGAAKPVKGASAKSAAAAQAQPSQPQPSAPAEKSAGDSFTVKSGDTLSSVARRVQGDGVSYEQVLVSLYRANPSAFDGNMNRLKRGKILRVPDRDAMASVSRDEAAKEIRLQGENWKNYRSQLAAAAGQQPAADAGGGATSGKISAKVEDKGLSQAEGNKDVLKLSKGGQGGDAQLKALQDEAKAQQKSLDEANQRVADLQKNIKDMEKALAIKAPAGAATTASAPVASASSVQAEVASAVAEVAAASAVPAVTASTVAEASPVAKKRKPVVIAPPVEEPSFIESMFENPLLIGGGLAAVLAGVGGLFWMRRRKPARFEDSFLTAGDLKPNTVIGSSGGAVITTQPTENSFLTDFSRQGLGTIDTDEVDPVAEAEVYMAYGRDAQAEEILRDALAKDGSRNEIRLKLLEIYAARKDRSAFEDVASGLFANVNGQGPVWEQAAYMGRNLDSANPLYQPAQASSVAPLAAAGAAVVAGGAAIAAVAAEQDDDFGLDLDLSADVPADDGASLAFATTEAAPLDEVKAEESGLDAMLDDLVDFDLGAPADAPATSELDDLSFDLPEAVSSLDAPTVPVELDLDSAGELDFPLDLELPDAIASAPLDLSAAPSASEGLDDELAMDFDFGELASSPAVTSVEPPLSETELAGLDLSLGAQDESDLALGEDDPVQTKIDLAKAYLDMGDTEGAREILQEALGEGGERHKAEAQRLLAEL